MIMQSSVENTDSLINIRALGNFPFEKQSQADPYIAIKTRQFGMIDLTGSYLSVLFPPSYFLLASDFKAKFPDGLSGSLPQPVSNQTECRNIQSSSNLLHRPRGPTNVRVLVRDS